VLIRIAAGEEMAGGAPGEREVSREKLGVPREVEVAPRARGYAESDGDRQPDGEPRG